MAVVPTTSRGGNLATDSFWVAKGNLAVATAAAAASPLTVGSDNTVLTADAAQSTGVKWAAAAAGLGAILFDSTVAGSDAASIDTGAGGFSGSYEVLVVLIYSRTDEVVGGTTHSVLDLTFNNDVTATYDWVFNQVNNTTQSGSPSAGNNQFRFNTAGASTAASVFGNHTIIIPNYAGTAGYKSGTVFGGIPSSTAGQTLAWQQVIAWRSTSALNRLILAPDTSGKKLKIGSRLTVLGF